MPLKLGKNPLPGKCDAMIPRDTGSMFSQYVHCDHNVLEGRRTCRKHSEMMDQENKK